MNASDAQTTLFLPSVAFIEPESELITSIIRVHEPEQAMATTEYREGEVSVRVTSHVSR